MEMSLASFLIPIIRVTDSSSILLYRSNPIKTRGLELFPFERLPDFCLAKFIITTAFK